MPDALQPRQREALVLHAEGFSAPQIAERMGISVGSAQDYVDRAKRKLGMKTRIEVIEALERGLIPGGLGNPVVKARGVRDFANYLLSQPVSRLGPAAAPVVVAVAELAEDFARKLEDNAPHYRLNERRRAD